MPRQKSLCVSWHDSADFALQNSTTSPEQAASPQAWQKPAALASGSGGGSSSTVQPMGRPRPSKIRAISGFFILVGRYNAQTVLVTFGAGRVRLQGCSVWR